MPTELLVQGPDGGARSVALEGDRFRVGRSSTDNDLCFADDMSLSRWHLVFERDGDFWRVRDLNTKNKTFVNGRMVEEPLRLRPGDRITAGRIVLVFEPEAPDISKSVVFVPSQPGAPVGATVMTSLRGIFSQETTLPGRRASARPESPVDRKLPLHNFGVLALLRAGREMLGHRPVQELFQLILDLSIEAVGAERGVVMILEGDRLVARAVRGAEFRISTAVRDRVIQDRASLLVRDTRLDEALKNRESIVGQHILTMMAVPLQTRDRVIGLVEVDSSSLAPQFTQEDLELLTILANVAAIRIEQERAQQVELERNVMTRELEQAALIQRRLLPDDAPSLVGLDLAGHNAACRTVGGDYYDFFTYADGRLGIVLGDVTGKGMPAALLMTSLHAAVQILAAEGREVAETMARLDRVMAKNCPSNRFVSLFYAIVDPRSGEIEYCNAGHNPPLLVRADGTSERLEGGGTILGMFPEEGYESRRTSLRDGDMLAVFSDGVTESHDPAGEEFGEARLAALLARHRTAGAAEVVRETLEEVSRFTGGAHPEDDVTLVVLRRNA